MWDLCGLTDNQLDLIDDLIAEGEALLPQYGKNAGKIVTISVRDDKEGE